MGFNTVAFLLNDFMHSLEKSPHTVTNMLVHPPMGEHDRKYHEAMAAHTANTKGEPGVDPQALLVLPTFHADQTQYFMAGGNCINSLKFVRFSKTKDGKKTVTLELPEWAQKSSKF